VIVLAIAGDRAAFAELVHRRQASVRGFLKRLCRDAALADDLAQDSFVQAWRTIGGVRDAAAFSGWLRRIALNAWLQHRRRQGARPLEVVDEAALATASIAAPDPTVAQDLDAALAALSDAQRLCVVLSYSEGLSGAEIAQATGLPLGTVKSHLARGAARLRELLVAYRGGPDDR
jgi:RNA polymerase sigma-70 factor (ECF subfamily)